MFNDPTIRAAKIALDGLSARSNVISQNIANVDTPGYHAQEIDFESALQTAMRTTGKLPLTRTDEGHNSFSSSKTDIIKAGFREGGTERADGNNVDIDLELLNMTETGIRFNAVSQVVSKKLSLLKSIAGR